MSRPGGAAGGGGRRGSEMTTPNVRALRAYTVGSGGGGDYHDQAGDHWIDDHIATPMAVYPAYRASRRAFGLNVLGTLVVEAEADDGTIGFAVTTGGIPAAWIVEHHLARFVEGAPVADLSRIWDQMYRSTLFYGRKGLVVNAISAVDLALWDLLGRLRDEPVYHLLGGAVRDEQPFYATGARPDLAEQMGFVGGKIPLHHGPAEGESGLEANIELARHMRERVSDEFWLAYDCWMSLDVRYALRLAYGLDGLGVRWLEEPLPPDDYWGYADLRARMPPQLWVTTGEHEATRFGFRLLMELGHPDAIQPDVNWCGGLTELVRIAALADSRGTLVIPHGSSVYSFHFVVTQHVSPFAEFLMMAPDADRIVPMFTPLLLGEPVPVNGRLRLDDRPGFGVELNRECGLERPYTHEAG